MRTRPGRAGRAGRAGWAGWASRGGRHPRRRTICPRDPYYTRGSRSPGARQAMTAHSELIVSVSGIRGIVGRSLTPAVALAFASALGEHVHGGPVVVSRDGRPSGKTLRFAVLAGLTAAGCEVHDLGV